MPIFLFSSEVSGNLSPFGGFPLNDGVSEIVCVEPLFSSQNDLIELFCLWRTLQFGLAFAFLDPKDGVVRIRIDRLIVQTLIPTEGESMNNGKKLPDIIGAVNGAEVKHPITRLKVNGLILHRPGITTTGSIHSPSVCPHLHRQGQYRIIAIIWRILHHILSGTSMPNRPMPFLIILATFLASTRRKSFFCSSGSLRIE